MLRWALLCVMLSVSACGPVKFSGLTSKDVEPVNTPPPTTSPTPTDPSTLRDVNYRSVVASKDNKLDIVLIVDDSNSMLADNQKLASRLSGFVSKLQASNIDWQMCATVTRALPVSANATAWGASIYWQSSSTASTALGMVLRKGQSNLANIFTHTINYINAGWVGSDDERAIKAAYHHVYNGDYRYSPNNGCYRPDSAIAYIIISDEDERSVGGDASQKYYANELKPLENEDKPQVFVDYVKSTFGADRRFTVNSIIVQPGDSACKASQDKGSAISHYGFKYAELSQLTAGGIGSICDADYSTNLNLFVDRINDSLSSVPLECQPVGNVNVTITPSAGTVTTRIEGMNLMFDTPVPAGRTIDIKYQCAESRSPSSEAPATEMSFFAKIILFFKNLF